MVEARTKATLYPGLTCLAAHNHASWPAPQSAVSTSTMFAMKSLAILHAAAGELVGCSSNAEVLRKERHMRDGPV